MREPWGTLGTLGTLREPWEPWEPWANLGNLGNLYLGTWEPLLGNLYLGTWEPLLGNLYLEPGNLGGMGFGAAPVCSETFTMAEDPKAFCCWGKISIDGCPNPTYRSWWAFWRWSRPRTNYVWITRCEWIFSQKSGATNFQSPASGADAKVSNRKDRSLVISSSLVLNGVVHGTIEVAATRTSIHQLPLVVKSLFFPSLCLLAKALNHPSCRDLE